LSIRPNQIGVFFVNQGVRQRGVLSSFLFFVFINDLLKEVDNCSKNTGVLDVSSCCPSLADDISYISLSPNGLQTLLNTADIYAHKWRFRSNAAKSCVLTFCSKTANSETMVCRQMLDP
jgi:hypothetical protein